MAPNPALLPLGRLTITAAGTTTLLSANCGPLGGQPMTNWQNPPAPGQAFRDIELQADSANSGNVYLLPRGNTASANPGSIIAVIGPGGSLPFPNGLMGGVGITPENFCLDTDAGSGTQYCYGYGVLG